MSDTRPLPSNPSLEFERKAAKALLKSLRAGDSAAIARAHARHDAISASTAAQAKLADAQLVIAREYGFTSWPRLVRYFGDMARHNASDQGGRAGWRFVRSAAELEGSVRQLLAGHQNRMELAGRTFAAYVPRFYGLTLPQVFDSVVSESDARLAVARTHGCSRWEDVLRTAAESERLRQMDPWHVDEFFEANQAIRAGDLAALVRIVEQNPGMLEGNTDDGPGVQRLLRAALSWHDRSAPHEVADIIAWLVSRGADLSSVVTPYLLGVMRMRTDRVAWLLELGADPNWIAPNGLSVLDHALLRWWNGEAVDVLAARARHRDALWIAAGLGDVAGVARWFDARGNVRAEARRDRPDFSAAHPSHAMPMIPEPSDEELVWESFVVAVMNERASVIEYLAQRGVDVNSRMWEQPVLLVAVGNGWTRSVEALLRCGADPDLRGSHPATTAREMARDEWVERPRPAFRRIVELLGFDPDALLAEHHARPVPEPEFSSRIPEVLLLAGDDAHRCSETVVTVEHLLFGLIRARCGAQAMLKHASRMDVRRFARHYRDRLLPHHERVDGQALVLSAAVETALADARALSKARRREQISAEHILLALVQHDDTPIAQLLREFDADLGRLRRELER